MFFVHVLMFNIQGSSHGMDASDCDAGYEAEARRLCDKEEDPLGCSEAADLLLIDLIQVMGWTHNWVTSIWNLVTFCVPASLEKSL